MRIILSPAKKMNVDTDKLECQGLPVFLEQTQEILDWLLLQSHEDLQKLWSCNDSIAEQNFKRIKEMDLGKRLTPAILSYEGIAFQYMAPAVFEDSSFDYVQEHLRILSGFYGVLKPMDGVTPYRLEMQAKAKIGGHKDLYDLWGDRLYREVRDESGVIVNLASKEYSKCIEKYLGAGDHYVTVTFGEMAKGKFVTKGTYAKMARGEMVRFMAERGIEDPKEIRSFDRLGYVYRDDLSSDNEIVFERKMVP
ncbi:peroxide stress protein YaaA [Butyrivibrio sp. XPD2006]|uniref:peroxide stress protein YaaA n=1 Tax=Butyrivibrio sp. XPD2006 TaxID=1280668 RepID=UPI0003B686B7|nr:peroxide stress protein YaaA [Butyrivibrio sp. XPD2006]